MEAGQITAINVESGGFRYSNPKCIVIDAEEAGSGCTTTVSHTNGVINSINIVSPGSGYVDPYAYVYDETGKFVATTSNIGRITSMSVDDYGRNITTDTTLNPEIHPVVRLVVGNVTGTFVAGDVVYEGTDDYRTSFGTVVAYEEERQILSLETVEGEINKGKQSPLPEELRLKYW